MYAFGQLYLASLREWRRDSTALLWSMAFPIVIALLIGVVFSSTGTVFFRISVVNEAGDNGQLVVDGFRQNAVFRIDETSREDAMTALNDGRREAVVIITAEAAAALVNQQAAVSAPSDQVPLEVHYDTASVNAQAVLSLIQETITSIDARLTGKLPLLTMQTVNTSAQHLRSADTMLPGVLAMSLMLIGLYVTAIPLVSLRQKEVLRRMGVTPLSRVTLLVAQVTFRLTVAFIQACVVIAISVALFDLPLKMAQVPAITGMVVLGASAFITLGYVLAALSQTEEAVQVVVGLVFLVFTILSGALVPLWRIPQWIRPLVETIPLTYLADALRQLMVDANPAYSMMRNVYMLAGWLVVCTLLALRFFRWEPQS